VALNHAIGLVEQDTNEAVAFFLQTQTLYGMDWQISVIEKRGPFIFFPLQTYELAVNSTVTKQTKEVVQAQQIHFTYNNKFPHKDAVMESNRQDNESCVCSI